MKTQRAYPRFTITRKGTQWVEQGHPWIYEGEILSCQGNLQNGCLADAVSEKGKYLGTGFYSQSSKIRLRLISRNANDTFDEAFWRRRIQYAWDYRKVVMGDDLACCRVIFGEADGFPGLTVDRFNDILVAQTLSVGMEQIKPLLFRLLPEVLRADGQQIAGIFERNDVAIRGLEGLEQYKGWYGEAHPASPVTEIVENGIRYAVDVENGQKTGFFLDQKYNRLAVARLAKGRRVLDCFTHTGSFALNAARGGAEHVTAVDVSESAIAMARENARRNGIGNVEFFCGDASAVAADFAARGLRPDVICVDPPRKGLSPDVVSAAARMQPQRIVYVSCDPATLARDVKLFAQEGYGAVRAAAVDMFPGTANIESVVRLERTK